jgi:hypothetical protein
MKQARDFLGALYYEPILVAKSLGVTYYADDASMRALASNSHGVASFSTQALLRTAKHRGFVSNLQYEDAIITLLRHNYYFVSESAETLERLAYIDEFEPSVLSIKMLSRVADPKIDQLSATGIISDFCYHIWRVDFSKTKADRDRWLSICADSILQTKTPDVIFVQFLANLGIKSLAQPYIFGGIAHWFLRSGKLSKQQRMIFYIAVQQAILQMASLAKKEFFWWPALSKQWKYIGRINLALERSGWI